MVDLTTTPDFVEGGVVAAISVISVLLYLNFIDGRIMERDRPMSQKLTITPNFRLFAGVCIACSFIISVAILKLGMAGTTEELLFTLILTVMLSLIVCFLAIQVFLTSIHIYEDTVTTQSPLGRKEVRLGKLTSISINERFQFELSDAEGTLRFCHYVEGKRALIEHIIAHAPANATVELREFLEKSELKKKPCH